MLRKEKLQIVEEKMKQRRFLASALLIISRSCILRNTMTKNSLLHHRRGVNPGGDASPQ